MKKRALFLASPGDWHVCSLNTHSTPPAFWNNPNLQSSLLSPPVTTLSVILTVIDVTCQACHSFDTSFDPYGDRSCQDLHCPLQVWHSTKCKQLSTICAQTGANSHDFLKLSGLSVRCSTHSVSSRLNADTQFSRSSPSIFRDYPLARQGPGAANVHQTATTARGHEASFLGADHVTST